MLCITASWVVYCAVCGRKWYSVAVAKVSEVGKVIRKPEKVNAETSWKPLSGSSSRCLA